MNPDELREMIRVADQQYDAAIAAGNNEQAELIANDIRGMMTHLDQAPAPVAPETGAVEQTMSGVNEGLADSIYGAPVDLVTGIINSPQTLSNLIGRGVNWATGEDTMRTDYEPFIEDPVGGSEWFREKFAEADMIAPYNEDYEFARKSGQFFGNAVGAGTGLAGAASSGLKTGSRIIDDVAQSTAQEVAEGPGRFLLAETMAAPVAVGGGMYGGDVGEAVGPRIGIDPETGRQYGETAGEFIGALLGATGGYGMGAGARKMWGTSEAGDIYDAAKRQGVTPTAGLVSPSLAGPIENAAAGAKLVGPSMARQQEQQVADLGTAKGEMTDAMRGGQDATLDKSQIGERVREEGYEGLEAIDQRLTDLQEEIYAATGGRDAMFPTDRVVDIIDEFKPGMDAAGVKAINGRIDDLITSGQPIDTQLHEQLMTRLRYEEANDLPSDMTRRQLAMNTEINGQALEKWRSRLGREFEGRPPVDSEVQGGAYRGIRDTQRSAAAGTDNPDDLANFEGAVAEKQRLVDKATPLEEGADKDFLERLTTAGGRERGSTGVYNFLTDKNAPEKITAYQRNVSPEQFERTMGDLVDQLGVNPSRKGVTNSGEFDPGHFLKNWENLPEPTRQKIMEIGDVDTNVSDIIKLSRAMEKRAQTGTTSSTYDRQSTAAITAAFFANPALTLVGLISANRAGKYIMSDKVARAIADKNPAYRDVVMQLTARRGPAAANTDSSEGDE